MPAQDRAHATLLDQGEQPFAWLRQHVPCADARLVDRSDEEREMFQQQGGLRVELCQFLLQESPLVLFLFEASAEQAGVDADDPDARLFVRKPVRAKLLAETLYLVGSDGRLDGVVAHHAHVVVAGDEHHGRFELLHLAFEQRHLFLCAAIRQIPRYQHQIDLGGIDGRHRLVQVLVIGKP